MNISELNPTIVWKYFHEITQVPRPSKKEEKIIKYLEDFAKEHNLPYKKDKVSNIIISKPATPGYEHLQTVILQSHMDMVCEKNSDVTIDFENDPIQVVIDGEWVKAKGTTLGADNGIGVAAELALLASNDIEHGPIECLFTVDEETGLTGAQALEAGFMTGKILLNLDSEDEGEIFIGCAGGKGTTATFTYTPQSVNDSLSYMRIDVKGLKGGHSGGDIHQGLGNANKILARFLYLLNEACDFTLCEISGGNLHNAIPREAHAVVGVAQADREKARVLANTFSVEIENEFKFADPDVKLEMGTTDKPTFSLDNELKLNLIHSLNACPHGVYGMSHEIHGLVETSTNLASVKMKEGNQIVVVTSQRSSTNSAKEALANEVASTFLLAKAEVVQGDGYPGWAPNADSEILKVSKETYIKLFGKEPKIMAIHAGLECGLFLEKYPYLDMISFGPTMRDVHSPNERMEIKTVDMWWRHLLEVLKNIPADKQ